MRCSEIITYLEQMAPVSCACEWDNVGLLAGRREKEVKKIYLALDATDQVIEAAISCGADLLITHHPLIFKPLYQVNDDDFISRRILTLIQNDISYYVMHTNFDSAPGCMADLAADRLSLTRTQILESMGQLDGVEYGIGKTGFLETSQTLKELSEFVKQKFGLPYVVAYGNPKSEEVFDFAAVSPGSGKSMIGHSLKAGAKVLITGDIGHHEGIDAIARGVSVIDAGHYGLEILFIEFMEQQIMGKYGNQVTVYKAEPAFPSVVY